MAYVLYACLNLYGVMLHLDGYATRRGCNACNDDYYIRDANVI